MLFGILILQTYLHVVKSSVILSPSPALAVVQESFTWTCTYNGSETVSGFQWSLNGNTLAVIVSPACTPFDVPGPPDPSIYEYACLSTSQATFTVKQISDMNNGNGWRCAVAAPGYIYSNNVTVTVQVSVNRVSLTPPSGSIRENVETTFTCETSTSRPVATITWYKELITGQKQVVTSKVSYTTESVGDLEKSTSVLRYAPSRSDNRYKIYCQASNIPERTTVMSTKFQMDVQYSPESAPYIQNYSNGNTYKVIEDNQGELSCTIKGGNPLASLTWTCFNNGLSTETIGTSVTKTVTWSATRGTDRSCTCHSSHPIAGTQSVSVNVQVLYMASVTSFTVNVKGSLSSQLSVTVNEKADVQFICLVDSNPGSSIEIQLQDKTLYRKESVRTLIYNHTGATCLDTGVYTCSAYNLYNNGKVSEKKLNLFVRCYPRPLTPVKENVTSALRDQSSFSFKGLAYPIPIFTWLRKQGTTWKELSNNTHLSISITGVDTNLTIKNVSQSDYGEYQLKIENEIDIFIQHYTLIPEDIPENPRGFQHLFEELTESSITVQWIPGLDNGPRQTFVLRYKKNSDRFWTDINIPDNGEKTMIYTVTSLTSGTLYNFVLYARNKIGNSSQTDVLGIRTDRSSHFETDSCHNEKTTAIIVACVLGIVTILLACYAGYITLLLKRTKGEQHENEMQVTSSAGTGVPVFANLSYSATENNEHECIEMSNAVFPSSNIDTNEYISLDDELRDNKETYDVINAKR